jgi:hypothetical protein
VEILRRNFNRGDQVLRGVESNDLDEVDGYAPLKLRAGWLGLRYSFQISTSGDRPSRSGSSRGMGFRVCLVLQQKNQLQERPWLCVSETH